MGRDRHRRRAQRSGRLLVSGGRRPQGAGARAPRFRRRRGHHRGTLARLLASRPAPTSATCCRARSSTTWTCASTASTCITSARLLHALPERSRACLAWDDDDQAAAEVRGFSAHDAEALPRYRALAQAVGGPHLPLVPDAATVLAEMTAAVAGTDDEPLLERLLFGSVSDLLDEFFESDEVKGGLAMAWDAGDPDAPGSLLSGIFPAVSQFTADENYGIVVGGMGGITKAMRRVGRGEGRDRAHQRDGRANPGRGRPGGRRARWRSARRSLLGWCSPTPTSSARSCA